METARKANYLTHAAGTLKWVIGKEVSTCRVLCVSLAPLEGQAACCLLSGQSRRAVTSPSTERLLKLGRLELFHVGTTTLWTVESHQCGRKNNGKQKAWVKLNLISGINVWVLLKKQATTRPGLEENKNCGDQKTLARGFFENSLRWENFLGGPCSLITTSLKLLFPFFFFLFEWLFCFLVSVALSDF